eukprot:4633935-Prymnesium_polylepis.2
MPAASAMAASALCNPKERLVFHRSARLSSLACTLAWRRCSKSVALRPRVMLWHAATHSASSPHLYFSLVPFASVNAGGHTMPLNRRHTTRPMWSHSAAQRAARATRPKQPTK